VRGLQFVILMSVLWGCSTAGPQPGTTRETQKPVKSDTAQEPALGMQAQPAEVVLEAETFELKNAKIVEIKGASGGKAILFEMDTGVATLTVPMKKGTYEVTAYGQGVDEEQDAFYVAVGSYEERVFPDEYGKIVATKAFRVVVPQDGPCKVVISAAEPNVHVDRIVIKPVL
ncbi:MAG: hypothetical protein ACUVWX_09085, partial [Kiritimatiellia bacterium]